MTIDLTQSEAIALAEFINDNLFNNIKYGDKDANINWVLDIVHSFEKLRKACGQTTTANETAQETVQETVQAPEEPELEEVEPEEIDPKVDEGKICSLYNANWSIKDIIDEMKVSTKTIYAVLKKHNIPKRTRATYANR